MKGKEELAGVQCKLNGTAGGQETEGVVITCMLKLVCKSSLLL
jgi:hypothetical protein